MNCYLHVIDGEVETLRTLINNYVVFRHEIVCCTFTENLALHRPAWQNTTYWSNIAERAVDGLKSNLDRHGRQCALSWDHQTTAEWRVDLGAIRSIHHVSIQYVTGNDMWGSLSY